MASQGKYALAALFTALGLFGFMATIGQIPSNGLGEVLMDVSGVSGKESPPDLLHAPAPFKRSFTGISFIDGQLGPLVVFVASLVDDPGASYSTWAFFIDSMGQFVAGWTLLVLEGRRSGNRGRAVSWIATLGLIYQKVSWALAVPVYFALHLLTSPISKLDGKGGKVSGEVARQNLFVYLWDLALIPVSITLSLVIPTIFMSLPSLFSPATHYNWIAFWVPFPLWTIVIQDVLHNACYYGLGSLTPQDANGKATTPGKGYMAAVSGVYQFALTAAVITHAPFLFISLLPSPIRSALASAFPSAAPFLEQVTFTRTFVPYPIFGQPAADPANYGPGELSPLVADFYQYDLYAGNTPMLLWALYLNVKATGASTWDAARKAAIWTVLGGQTAGALALLWDRDQVVTEGETEAKKK